MAASRLRQVAPSHVNGTVEPPGGNDGPRGVRIKRRGRSRSSQADEVRLIRLAQMASARGVVTADRNFRTPRRVLASGGLSQCRTAWRQPVNGLIYLIGLIVVIMAILSFFGLR